MSFILEISGKIKNNLHSAKACDQDYGYDTMILAISVERKDKEPVFSLHTNNWAVIFAYEKMINPQWSNSI